jgi:hypothetical protein
MGSIPHEIDDIDISRETSVDTLDHESFYVDMGDSAFTTKQKTVKTAFDSIWNVPQSPESEPTKRDTSTIDEGHIVPDDHSEVENESWGSEPFKYHLHPQTRELKGTFTRTWIGRDESGNYGEKLLNEENRKRRRLSRIKFQLRTELDPNRGVIDGEGGSRLRPTGRTIHHQRRSHSKPARHRTWTILL